MKAAVVTEIKQPFVVRDDVTLDSPIEHEVLIDVKASGLCHSDIASATEGINVKFPAVLGHEVAGVVREVGPGVTDFAAGDHVAACLLSACGHCDRCRSGRPYQCSNYPQGVQRAPGQPPRMRIGGEPVHQFCEISGFAEQVLLHENTIVRIPPEVPFPQASLLGCGVVTGAGAAINTAGVRVGDNVAVIGCGGVGLNVIQGARVAGARKIIAVDLVPGKLELAKKFGATHTVNPADGDSVAAVRDLTGGGVDAAFEVIGLPQTLEQAFAMLGMGGQAFAVGMAKPTATIELRQMPLLFTQAGLRGVTMGSSIFKRDIPLYCELYLQGRFNLDDLVSQEISINDINEAYVELEKGGIARSVITSF